LENNSKSLEKNKRQKKSILKDQNKSSNSSPRKQVKIISDEDPEETD